MKSFRGLISKIQTKNKKMDGDVKKNPKKIKALLDPNKLYTGIYWGPSPL